MKRRVRIPFAAAFRPPPKLRASDQKPDTPTYGRFVPGRRSVVQGAISEGDLEKIVREDLVVLLNTVHFAAGTDLSDHPHVATSILNFGFPDLLHRSIDEARVGDIASEIDAALSTFEPRLVPGSLRVTRDTRVSIDEFRIRFVIAAEIDSEPLNLPVQFVAELERDTGKITVQRQ